MSTFSYKDIDLSFKINPLTKDILTKIDSSAVKQSIKLLVETSLYSRGFNKASISIFDDLFNNYYPSMDIIIKSELKNIIESEEPRVDLDRIEVDSSNISNGELIISVFYNILNNPALESLSITLERLR